MFNLGFIMKRKKTQRFLLLFAMLAFLSIKPMHAQQFMRVNLNDGTVIEVAIADIQKLTFDLTTGIQNNPEVVKQLLKLNVYPNPARDQVSVDYSLVEKGRVMIDIFTMNGLLLESINRGFQLAGDYNFRLNTNQLASGTYILKVQQNKAFVTQKIIVKQ